MLQFIDKAVDLTSSFGSLYALQKASFHTVLASRYLTPSIRMIHRPAPLLFHSNNQSSFVLTWLKEEIKKQDPDSFTVIGEALLHSYCTSELIQVLLDSIPSTLSQFSLQSLLRNLRIFYTLSSNHKPFHLNESQKEQIVSMSIQTLLSVLEWNDESALVTCVPYLSSIILCFPSISFTIEHLTSILILSRKASPSLQYDLYLVFHFIVNNWRDETDIQPLLEQILFASDLPADLIQSDTEAQDPVLIEQVLQSSASDFNREYTFDW